ncbi:MAG: GAF domain-containing protein, partial [Terriglobales bacterium]
MAAATTATGIPDIARQDRPRRRSLGWIAHWRPIGGALLLASLVLVAVLAKQRWIDIMVAAVGGAAVVAFAMDRHARSVRAHLARDRDDTDRAAMLDLGSAARASHSLDDFLNFIAQGLAAMTGASPIAILLREPASGRFYCRYRYPTLAVGLNSEPIWLEQDAFSVRRLRSLSMPLALDPADYPSWVEALPGEARLRRRFECDVLSALESRLLVQVVSQGELNAIVSIGPGAPFDAAMKREMVAMANQVSLAIENSFLVRRVAEGERLRREVEMAAEVQRKL